MGTIRVLLPLPSTRTVRSARSTAATLKPDEFGQAQPRGVEQFHDGLVARRQGIVDAKFQQPAHLIGIQSGRQPLLGFGARTSSAGLRAQWPSRIRYS